LERLGLDHLITEILAVPEWLPAATQGTIGIQCRTDDDEIIELIEPLKDADAVLRTRVERAVATALQGSCQVPLAVFASLEDEMLGIRALVGMPDGSRLLKSERSGPASAADQLAAAVAEDLLGQGAGQIIASLG
jgi:hydroxymethylbilane synthase